MSSLENIEIRRLEADLNDLKQRADKLRLDIVSTLLRMASLELQNYSSKGNDSDHSIN